MPFGIFRDCYGVNPDAFQCYPLLLLRYDEAKIGFHERVLTTIRFETEYLCQATKHQKLYHFLI